MRKIIFMIAACASLQSKPTALMQDFYMLHANKFDYYLASDYGDLDDIGRFYLKLLQIYIDDLLDENYLSYMHNDDLYEIMLHNPELMKEFMRLYECCQHDEEF